MTWILTAVSLAGNYFNSRKRIAGFYIWIVCNTGWLIYDIKTGLFSRAFLDIVQTALCLYGIKEWTKDDKQQDMEVTH